MRYVTYIVPSLEVTSVDDGGRDEAAPALVFSPDDLDDYRRSKYGELEDLAKTALEHPAVDLTEKQETICRYLVSSERPSEIARKLKQSRQAVHSQISLIKEKVSRIQPKKASPQSPSGTSSNTTRARKSPIPLRPAKK